jgi:hypothetical protein
VPADYIEDTITKMLAGYCLEKKANRYLTAFPIFTDRVLGQIKEIAAGASGELYEAVAAELIRGAAELKSLPVNERQGVYLLLYAMSYFINATPYDGSFAFPIREDEDAWVVKAYSPDGGKVSFPLNMFYIDSRAESGGDTVGFLFNLDASPLWMDAANDPACAGAILDILDGRTPPDSPALELATRAGIVSGDGKLKCFVFESYDAYINALAPGGKAAGLQYEFMARDKEAVISAVTKLFPKRFDKLEPYINCEIRNFITIGFQEYLLGHELLEPVPYLLLRRNADNPDGGDGTVTMY